MSRFLDWLDLNNYGYPLGPAALIGAGIALICGAWLLAVPLFIIAAVMCWTFG